MLGKCSRVVADTSSVGGHASGDRSVHNALKAVGLTLLGLAGARKQWVVVSVVAVVLVSRHLLHQHLGT